MEELSETQGLLKEQGPLHSSVEPPHPIDQDANNNQQPQQLEPPRPQLTTSTSSLSSPFSSLNTRKIRNATRIFSGSSRKPSNSSVQTSSTISTVNGDPVSSSSQQQQLSLSSGLKADPLPAETEKDSSH